MTTITQGQSLLDVAVQELGSVAALFDLADANGLAITEVLRAGQSLAVPASAGAAPGVASYFAGRGQRLNTGTDTIPATIPRPVIDWRPGDFTPNDFLTV